MPEDKRPKTFIDMTADHVHEPAPHPEHQGNGTPGGEAASQQPETDPPPPSTPRRSGAGFFSLLLAAILGGLVTAGAGYVALQQDIPGFSLTDVQTDRRLKELEERTASIASEIGGLRPQGLVSGSPSPAPEESNAVHARLDAIADLARGIDGTVQSLAQRVQAAEQRSKDAEAKDAVQAQIASQTAPLQQRLAAAEHQLEAVNPKAVQAQIASETAPLQQRLAAAGHELEALSRAQNENQMEARAAALTLALTNLKRAIATGRPFAAELDALQALSAAKLPISQLAPYVKEGVPTSAELESQFADASRKTIEKHYSGKADTFMDAMLSRAKSAIQVKPADGSGDTVEAILGRMGAAIKAGDLKAALVQGAALQNPPQAMKEWFGKAEARVTADETLRKTDQELLASLTGAAVRHQ